MKILLLDTNHEYLKKRLLELNFEVIEDYDSSKSEIEKTIESYTGIVIRSRFPIDKTFLDKAKKLKFIARVGAGLENIAVEYAQEKNIKLFAAPEGNRDAVAEHTLGMLLCLMHKLKSAHQEIQEGKWIRAANRGHEIMGKTIGIIGYGNMGKAFAKRLIGFDCRVICYDIVSNVGDEYAKQVDLEEFMQEVDVISLHTPQTPLTIQMLNATFFNTLQKSIYLVNTARGNALVTHDLVNALKTTKVIAAALDVLEYESSSFEHFFEKQSNPDLDYLLQAPNVLLTPHIAGWTHESNYKMAARIIAQIEDWIIKIRA